ncbi:zinc finger protein interacting with ribonucleoprotein K-like isoform X2 [Periplaneta americana]|uniref:zinc finger protein interacting with ribonucleoprotein K-like isoform X2 n=1 Tax=Periplaneta americana TaxID=6978 RepID=UPI0037E80889
MDGVSSYHNRCRLCICEARLSLKLFETEAIRLDLVNKIRSYLSINISLHDGMPQQICYECLSRIELFHSYKQSCLESQHTLKHWELFCEGSPTSKNVEFNTFENEANFEEIRTCVEPTRVVSPSVEILNSPTNISQERRTRSRPVSPKTGTKCEGEKNECRPVKRSRGQNSPNVCDRPEEENIGRRTPVPSLPHVGKGTAQVSTSPCMQVAFKPEIQSPTPLVPIRKKSPSYGNNSAEDNSRALRRPPCVLMQNSLKADTRPLVTFPDSVANQSKDDRFFPLSVENENSEIAAWLEEQEGNDNQSDISDQKNLDSRTESDSDQSTQALLRILESDEESDDDFLSDFENSHIENVVEQMRKSLPESKNSEENRDYRDPTTAYVRVEKLSEKKEMKLRVRSEAELKASTPPVTRSGRRSPSPGRRSQSPGRRSQSPGRRSQSPRVKTQSNQYRLVKPIVEPGTNLTRYKCLKCGSVLARKYYIKEHMKIHTGDKSFVCTVCDRGFRNNYMLKSHMFVHKTEKDHKCDICGNQFVGPERLKQHMKIHLPNPYSCPVCGRTCNQKQSLQRHMRVHTGERPFKCEFCSNAFADRTTWINHRRIHTGERPFSCKECGKTFSRLVNLQAHKNSHSNVRPFGCQLCMSRFKTKAHLVKHLSCIHKDLMKSVVSFMKDERPGEEAS